jgi:hypothetical protein
MVFTGLRGWLPWLVKVVCELPGWACEVSDRSSQASQDTNWTRNGDLSGFASRFHRLVRLHTRPSFLFISCHVKLVRVEPKLHSFTKEPHKPPSKAHSQTVQSSNGSGYGFRPKRSNGLGHKFVDWGNVKGILVPGKRVWKIKRARIMASEITEVVDAGDFQLGAGQLEQMMADIGEGFLSDRATGVTLDQLLPQAPDVASSPAAGSGSSNNSNILNMWPGMFCVPTRPAPLPIAPGPQCAQLAQPQGQGELLRHKQLVIQPPDVLGLWGAEIRSLSINNTFSTIHKHVSKR